MDDLRSTLADFDPDAPLPGMPDPWAFMPTPTRRPGPPWAMAEMIAAEPGLADRIAARLFADGSAEALASLVRGAAAAGAPVVATGCGTSEHAAMATAAILREAWRSSGFAGRGPVSAQAFELALDPPAGGVVIGISHEGGTTATMAAMAAGRGHGAATALITGSARVTGGRRGGRHARDRRDGPRLVSHRGVPVADRRRGRGRLGALGGFASRRGAGCPGPRRYRGLACHGCRWATPRRGDRRDDRRRNAPARHRHRRGPRHGSRAGAQGRGGGVGAVGGPRPRDLPPRPPARDRSGYGRAAHPHRACRAGRARQACPPGARGGRVARHASRGDPRGGRARPRSRSRSRRAAGSSSRRHPTCPPRRRRCSAARARSSW